MVKVQDWIGYGCGLSKHNEAPDQAWASNTKVDPDRDLEVAQYRNMVNPVPTGKLRTRGPTLCEAIFKTWKKEMSSSGSPPWEKIASLLAADAANPQDQNDVKNILLADPIAEKYEVTELSASVGLAAVSESIVPMAEKVKHTDELLKYYAILNGLGDWWTAASLKRTGQQNKHWKTITTKRVLKKYKRGLLTSEGLGGLIEDAGALMLWPSRSSFPSIESYDAAIRAIVVTLWADYALDSDQSGYENVGVYNTSAAYAAAMVVGTVGNPEWELIRATIVRISIARDPTYMGSTNDIPNCLDWWLWARMVNGSTNAIARVSAWAAGWEVGRDCSEARVWWANAIVFHDIIDLDNDVISHEPENVVGAVTHLKLTNRAAIHAKLHNDTVRSRCSCRDCDLAKRVYAGTVLDSAVHPRWGMWARKLESTAFSRPGACGGPAKRTKLDVPEQWHSILYRLEGTILRAASGELDEALEDYYTLLPELMEKMGQTYEGAPEVSAAIYKLTISCGACGFE